MEIEAGIELLRAIISIALSIITALLSRLVVLAKNLKILDQVTCNGEPVLVLTPRKPHVVLYFSLYSLFSL